MRVKICGLTRTEDVEAACEAGADALGFVGEPNSPRFVAPQRAFELARIAAPYVTTVSVFGTQVSDSVLMVVQASTFKPDVQLGRAMLTRFLREGTTVEQVLELSPLYLAIVLDAFVPGKSGGTGKTVDFDLAAEIVALSPRPVILAGGLTPENVAEAIRKVRPAGVDVSSGVESSPGIKDAAKMKAFIEAARSA